LIFKQAHNIPVGLVGLHNLASGTWYLLFCALAQQRVGTSMACFIGAGASNFGG